MFIEAFNNVVKRISDAIATVPRLFSMRGIVSLLAISTGFRAVAARFNPNEHYVTFNAHGSGLASRHGSGLSGATPGHAWTSFGTHDHQRKMSVDGGSYGKHAATLKSAFGGPGVIKSDRNRRAQTSSSHQVSSSQYHQARSAASAPAGHYSLFGSNCVQRQNRVASAAGLRPGGGGTPRMNVNSIFTNNRP